ncbi:MAG: OsmC family protein [Leptospiraceae bacterium]|nr:OsmC family protein [Leptospiraceae bacterium]MCP5502946.1 OsmC family protein [Leptospiraceae bacterium]
MEINIQRKNDAVLLEATNASGNSIQIDGAEKIGGTNAGPRPMELVLMGLGGCSSMDVLSILKKKRVTLDDFKVNIQAERKENEIPAVFEKIHLNFQFKGESITEDSVKQAVELSMKKYCSVTKMLEKTADITYSITIEN